MDKEYLSISEFAEAAGVSPQAIYKRLSTDLKEYATELNSRKVLKAEALQLFNIKEEKQPVNNELQQVVDLLKEQLKAKDEQIQRLQSSLELQQQLNAATLQTFKALPGSEEAAPAEVAEQTQPKKRHWWSR